MKKVKNTPVYVKCLHMAFLAIMIHLIVFKCAYFTGDPSVYVTNVSIPVKPFLYYFPDPYGSFP